MPISSIDMFNILCAKIGEQEAQALTDYVSSEISMRFEEHKDILATKAGLHQLELKIEGLRTEMKETKAEMIKWMFIFWAGQIAATIGIIMLFVKK